MAVLERVATLVRANLNDLIDRAEDPEKMLKQVMLDMENQLLQVKTQVAISMADQHARSELLLAQHRRARALEKASDAQLAIGDRSNVASFDRLQQKVIRSEAVSQAKSELVADDVDRRFDALERGNEVDRLLDALKARRGK